MKKIGIVTVLYNSATVLEEFFQSLKKQTYKNYILYIIDNNSQDESLKICKNELINADFEFKIIENSKNEGVAKGNNEGILKALEDNCDYILLANNDIKFKEDVLKKLIEAYEKTQEKIIVPKIYFEGSKKIWMAGGKFDNIRALTPHIGYKIEDNGQYNIEKKTTYAPTCFMIFDKEVFKNVGYMDELYFVYYDDSDYLWRCNEKGYQILYIPTIEIEHKVSVSTGGSDSNFTIKYINRNRLYFINKNFKSWNKIIAKSYFYGTRLIKSIGYNKIKRNSMWQGVKEGQELSKGLKK
ncbi:MAG: glycosyltransferase family 2 protein [Fusobacteriaceae bacterium]